MDFSWAKCTGSTCCNVSDGQKNEIIESSAVHAPGLVSLEKPSAVASEASSHVKEEDVCPGSRLAEVKEGSSLGNDELATTSYKDGSIFTGQLVNGKRHGTGNWKSATTEYEGQWVDDLQSGRGRQVWQDGRLYQGEFQKGKFDGRGRMEWHTPRGMMIYEGEYVDDSKHGLGKFVWPDGRVYNGEWRSGKRWGKGTYINVKGDQREGIWTDDKLEKWLSASVRGDKDRKEGNA